MVRAIGCSCIVAFSRYMSMRRQQDVVLACAVGTNVASPKRMIPHFRKVLVLLCALCCWKRIKWAGLFLTAAFGDTARGRNRMLPQRESCNVGLLVSKKHIVRPSRGMCV